MSSAVKRMVAATGVERRGEKQDASRNLSQEHGRKRLARESNGAVNVESRNGRETPIAIFAGRCVNVSAAHVSPWHYRKKETPKNGDSTDWLCIYSIQVNIYKTSNYEWNSADEQCISLYSCKIPEQVLMVHSHYIEISRIKIESTERVLQSTG